jgi:hypothetical protein
MTRSLILESLSQTQLAALDVLGHPVVAAAADAGADVCGVSRGGRRCLAALSSGRPAPASPVFLPILRRCCC